MTVATYCRNCGKALSDGEKAVPGTIYCGACAPQSSQASGAAASAVGAAPLGASVSPGLAALLGFIPGVGAIYNGQYAKGLMHVFIFGMLMSIADATHDSGQPLVILMMMGFYFYMVFEAYHTARRRQLGLPVDEFSSLVPLKGSAGSAVGPVLMIAAGTLFLLNNLGLLRIAQVMRYWPAALIALGVFMLRERIRPAASSEGASGPGGPGAASGGDSPFRPSQDLAARPFGSSSPEFHIADAISEVRP